VSITHVKRKAVAAVNHAIHSHTPEGTAVNVACAEGSAAPTPTASAVLPDGPRMPAPGSPKLSYAPITTAARVNAASTKATPHAWLPKDWRTPGARGGSRGSDTWTDHPVATA
jgi:hypothetical protein